jgi:predicted anti-sigma-YlaC factor YlaD
MNCDTAREVLSGELDNELADDERRRLEAHLASCAECRAVRRDLAAFGRVIRVRRADEVPDLVEPIMAAVELPRPRAASRFDWARYALLAVALTQLVLAVPALVLGENSGATVHVARELGSFDVALAAGLLVAAWQPRRAAGLLPFAVALSVATLVASVVDVASGRAATGAEAHHVVDLAGLALLWLVSMAATASPTRSHRVRPA